jgi:hypothetical protein
VTSDLLAGFYAQPTQAAEPAFELEPASPLPVTQCR